MEEEVEFDMDPEGTHWNWPYETSSTHSCSSSLSFPSFSTPCRENISLDARPSFCEMNREERNQVVDFVQKFGEKG